jgi:hypothetical protein
MAQTVQTQVIEDANTINALASQLLNLATQVNLLTASWNALNGATVMAAMGTVAQNADGSLGTADGSPTSGHPVNPALYPALSRATSAYNYGATLTILQQVATLCAGSAVATQSSAPTLLAEMTGG